MLQFELTENSGGIVLWGDYQALKPIHTFILDISDKSPILDNEGIVMGLAYDIRKAYESQREKDKQKIWDDEITIYGVEQVLPTLIAQIALLRKALAYIPATRDDHSVIYRLESFLESVIKGFNPEQGDFIISQYERLTGLTEKLMDETLGSRVAYFLSKDSDWRKDNLGNILLSIDPMYKSLHEVWVRNDAIDLIDPNEFEGWSWNSMDGMEMEL